MVTSKPDRVAVFIDGFNLYHFIQNNKEYRPYKWLDLMEFSKKFLPPKAIIKRVTYFSALPFWNPQKVKRHELYIKALESVGVKICLGYFKRVEKCVTLNKRLKLTLSTHEEKKTDVNIGIEMILAAHRDEFDIALLMSGDTDFHPVVEALKTEFPEKKVWVVVPNRQIVKPLDKLADKCSRIKKKQLATSQFPIKITLKSGISVSRPKEW